MNIVNFTPVESLTGGIIIGLAVAMLYLLRGNYTGISGIYSNVISVNGSGFVWGLFFIIGLIVGPVILSFLSYNDLGFTMPTTNPVLIILRRVISRLWHSIRLRVYIGTWGMWY